MDFSDRDIIKNYKGLNDYSGKKSLNDTLIKTVENFKPDLVVLGHADMVSNETLDFLKKTYPIFVPMILLWT